MKIYLFRYKLRIGTGSHRSYRLDATVVTEAYQSAFAEGGRMVGSFNLPIRRAS